MSNDDYMRIEATGFEALVLPYPITFTPPFSGIAPNPGAFEYWWQLIQYVFDLPDPSQFPASPRITDENSLSPLRRYARLAPELATSTILNHSAEMRVSAAKNDDGKLYVETIDSDFASNEVTRGFAALFRQYYSDEEKASFRTAFNILWRESTRAGDEDTNVRSAMLKQWSKAQRRLRGTLLKSLVRMRLCDEGKLADTPTEWDEKSPEFYISAYNYGEYLHWGKKRSELAAWTSDPYDEASKMMHFLEAVGGLSHLYLGFALIVDSVLGD